MHRQCDWLKVFLRDSREILSKWIYCDAIECVFIFLVEFVGHAYRVVQMTLLEIVKYFLCSPTFFACARLHVFVCLFFLINRDAKARFAQHSITIEAVYWYVLLRYRAEWASIYHILSQIAIVLIQLHFIAFKMHKTRKNLTSKCLNIVPFSIFVAGAFYFAFV